MSGWGLRGFGRPLGTGLLRQCALRAGSPVEMLTEPGWKNQHKVSSLEFVAAARKLGVTSTSLGHSGRHLATSFSEVSIALECHVTIFSPLST